MKRQLVCGVLTLALCVPLMAWAGQPGGGNGNPGRGNQGHGNQGGNPGHGNQGKGHQDKGQQDKDKGNQGKGAGHRNPGNPGAPDNDDPADPGKGKPRDPGNGHASGRGNSQGAAHANPRAIQAVCSHPTAAAHSALGIHCAGVVIQRDPKTGVRSYTQAGLEPALPTAAPPRAKILTPQSGATPQDSGSHRDDTDEKTRGDSATRR